MCVWAELLLRRWCVCAGEGGAAGGVGGREGGASSDCLELVVGGGACEVSCVLWLLGQVSEEWRDGVCVCVGSDVWWCWVGRWLSWLRCWLPKVVWLSNLCGL